MKPNLRFNRIETKNAHRYLDEFTQFREIGDNEFDGYLKCKLVHLKVGSVVLPDQIYFKSGKSLYWIQPFYFQPHIFNWDGDVGDCQMEIDISFGGRIQVKFHSNEVDAWHSDGSMLYRCRIQGPRNLFDYRTGDAHISKGVPYIRLFHHTTKASKNSIEKSQAYRSSEWNIRGNKKAKNVSFLYLTPLKRIYNDDDLIQIAMSAKGIFAFRLDENATDKPDLILDVERQSTTGKTHCLSQWVDARHLVTQPCYLHSTSGCPAYYEVVFPFIQRIGVEHGTEVAIRSGRLFPLSQKNLNFAIVGDANTMEGLEAPFNEEATAEKMHVEYLIEPKEIMQFWVENGNSDLVSGKDADDIGLENLDS